MLEKARSPCPPSAASNSVTPKPTFTVSASAGVNGSISPATQIVTQGLATSFTITPDTGGYTATASGCGGSLAGTWIRKWRVSPPEMMCSSVVGIGAPLVL